MKSKNVKLNVVFLTWYFPRGSGGFTYRKKILNLLSSIDLLEKIIVITADKELNIHQNDKIKILILNEHIPKQIIPRFFKFLLFQIKTLIKLTKLRNNYSVIVVMSGNNFAFPVLFSKLFLKKKIIYLMSGIGGISVLDLYEKNLLSRIIAILDELTLLLSDFIILESPGLKDVLKLDRYRQKVIQNGRMYVEPEKMQYKVLFLKRKNLIGYIGRLSPEKGVINFLHGIIELLKNPTTPLSNDFKIIIGGRGALESEIKKIVSKQKILNRKISFLGYVPDEKFVETLNNLKLLVFPSPTKSPEGLPNIILESLACGTPVLATSAGAISDIVIDSKTGFIMESNDPKKIAKNIVRALTHPELHKISRKSMKTIRKEFSFESALNRWQRILQCINKMEEEENKYENFS